MTALRELAERWKAESGQGDWRRAATYANELLSILDSEGDGGAVGAAWNAVSLHRDALTEIAEFAHDKSTGPAVPDALWDVRAMAYGALETLPATHPVRSGVVSDEDVRDAVSRRVGATSACSVCFGSGFDVAGKPCPFAPHIDAAIKSQGESNV